jgi:sialate O-acetylesterase
VSRTGYIDSVQKAENAAIQAWYTRLQSQDKGVQDGKRWYDPTYNASAWPTMQVPGFWEDQGLNNIDGVVWFRKVIEVPPALVGKPAQLWLGRIVDRDSVYINGTFVGGITYQYPPRIYHLPQNLLKPGRNVIVARVINGGGKGGFVPDKPYELVAGKQKIDLKGPWQYKLGATASPISGTTFFQYQPGGLYNAMTAPLTHYAIKGVIWYQGESNADRPQEYQKLFPAVIRDWRGNWGQGNFPFLFVQLANFMEAQAAPAESNWAATREAQRKTLALPKTGMAVITDIGEWNDIHPLNKLDVGKRLSLAAQKVAYGDNKVVSSGPLFQSMQVAGNKVVLTFSDTGGGLMAKGGGDLQHFAIAGADKKFVWAKAKIEKGKVVVWNDQLAKPVAVRYAWADNPEGANLYNKEGLPASPFRTDQ